MPKYLIAPIQVLDKDFFFTPDCISGVSPSQLLGTELVLAFLIIEEQVFLDFRAAIWK